MQVSQQQQNNSDKVFNMTALQQSIKTWAVASACDLPVMVSTLVVFKWQVVISEAVLD